MAKSKVHKSESVYSSSQAFHDLMLTTEQLAVYMKFPDTTAIPRFEFEALQRFCSQLNLSLFEQHCLLLLAGLNISTDVATAMSDAAVGEYPTFGYLLRCLSSNPARDQLSIAASGALRRFQLVHFADSNNVQTINLRPLVLDEWVFLCLLDHCEPDAVLLNRVERIQAVDLAFTQLQEDIVARGAKTLQEHDALQIIGSEAELRLHIALGLSLALERPLFQMYFEQIDFAVLDDIAMRWNRFAAVSDAILLIDLGINTVSEASVENPKQRIAEALCSRIQSKLIISGRNASNARPSAVRIEIERPSGLEQREYWQQRLERSGVKVSGVLQQQLNRLSYQFDFPIALVEKSIQQSLAQDDLAVALPQRLWDNSLGLVRPKLEGLTERIVPAERADWSKLILPEHDLNTLKRLVSHVRERQRIYDEWGWRRESSRGFAISALFGGSSGTGKTFSAEIIAKELGLDLQRIDLPSIVSKYIGESEKLLAKLFDAAEYGGCILLFDEADAIFGKRSEVKDSNDRYANLEVSYLLQRMESFRGLVILTTNQESNMDSAFLRRLRFVVHYPTPDKEARAKLWQGIFPPETPTSYLNYERLAQLDVSGGNIRNIALNAAFNASSANESVQMVHIRQAAVEEIRKIKRLPRAGEFDGW